ncbi:MAG: sterol desaturase family protein [Rhizobacter sp.]|nr:sterol desaturase family protein [Rhizobacter sp.]
MDKQSLQQAIGPEWQTWLAAVLLAVMAAAVTEGVVLSLRGRERYDWRAFAATVGDVVGRRAVDALGISLLAPLLLWAYDNRITTLTLDHLSAFVLLFIGQEFCYYGYHRAAHRVRWFWATHCVHHSPNQLTLAAALRLGWTGKLSGSALFFLPLVWLGFSPAAVLATVSLNLLYQFWLHAPWIPRLGPVEWVFNTPSHHRVHHASNPEYLDCNYGGVLIVFDRLFGTFVAERDDVPPRYGLTTPLTTYNPLRIALHGWLSLAQDLWAAPGWRARLRTLFGPPGAAPPKP